MPRLDHIRIAVRDYRASREWYVTHIGLKAEFENTRRKVAGLQDDFGLTLLLEESAEVDADSCVLYFQVDDVDAASQHLAKRGVPFVHPPRKRFWGYGAELKDPDGHRVRLWDEATMRRRG